MIIRDLYAAGASVSDRIMSVVEDAYVAELARAVGGALGGKAGVAPRLFLKKLVGDVLDRVDQFGNFDPGKHYPLTVNSNELTDVERNSAAMRSADDIELDV